jgi:hypothetical protein
MSFNTPQKIDRARAFEQMEDVRRQQGPRRAESEQRQEAAEIQQRQRNIDEAQQLQQERAARLNVVA